MSRSSLLLVSTRIDDHDVLQNAALPGVTTVLFAPASDSLTDILAKIEATGASVDGFDSIAFASHGNAGMMELSTDGHLTSESINEVEQQKFWQQLGEYLSDSGRIDLLACDLAATEEGRQLVDGLARLSQTRVNASEDTTGNGPEADWQLETGNIDTIASYFDAVKLQRFGGYLEVINGTAGDDELFGGAGDDTIYGGAGDDDIAGGMGDDILYTGAGDNDSTGYDTLYGGIWRENTETSNGNDKYIIERDPANARRLDGVRISDHADDESEQDTLDLTGFVSDIYELEFDSGTSGTADWLYIRNSASVISIDEQFHGFYNNDLGPGKHYGHGIEIIKYGSNQVNIADLTTPQEVAGALVFGATQGDNNLVGTDGYDQMDGLAGNDVLLGKNGDDELFGGAGDDTIYGGAGDDDIAGGMGDDILYTGAGDNDSTGYDTLYGGIWRENTETSNGNDKYIIERDPANARRLDGVRISDHADDESEQDTLDLTGFVSDIYELEFDSGTSGTADWLYIRNSASVISIDEQFHGFYNNDLGPGKHYGHGIEIIKYGSNQVNIADLTTPQEVAGALVFGATQGDNNLVGTDGYDQMDGLAGNDVLLGKNGDDELFGGAGDDTIYGGAGDDDIAGGMGDDILYTGAGDNDSTGYDTLYGGIWRENTETSNGNDKYIIERDPANARRLDGVRISDHADDESEQDTLDLTGFVSDIYELEFDSGTSGTADWLYIRNSASVISIDEQFHGFYNNDLGPGKHYGHGIEIIKYGSNQVNIADLTTPEEVANVVYSMASSSPNTAPSAQNDVATTQENTSVVIDVLANDSDGDGDSLTLTSTTAPAHGTVTITADQKIEYTPATGYFGSDSFNYTINDGNGGEDTGSVSVSTTEQSGGGSGTNLGNLSVLLQNDTFTSQSNGTSIAYGDATIGLAAGNSSMLNVTGGNYLLDGNSLTINGTFSSIIDGTTRQLYTGQTTFDLTTASAELLPTSSLYVPAGLGFEFSSLDLGSNDIRLFFDPLELPSGLTSDSITLGSDAIVIDETGLGFGLTGTLSFPDLEFNLFDALEVDAYDWSLSYDSLDDEFNILGGFVLQPGWDGIPGISSELTGDGLVIRDGDFADITLDIMLDDFAIKGWGFNDVGMILDTSTNSISGGGELTLPMFASPLEAEIGFIYDPFELDTAVFQVPLINPGIALGTTGWFVTGVEGGVSNMASSSPDPILFTGGVDLQVPAIIDLSLNGEVDENHISGTVDGHMLSENTIDFTGTATLDWDARYVELESSAVFADGLITGDFNFKSDFDLNLGATGSAQFQRWGQTLSGNYSLVYSNDGRESNDYVAAWATANLFSDPKTIGVRYSFDGDLGFFGQKEVPLYSSWIVDETISDLTVAVEWDNPATNVETRVVVYDDLEKTQVRQVINEADYAANNIAVVNEWSGNTAEIIYIDDPEAGLWDVEVVNASGLGNIEYSATTSLEPLTLTAGELTHVDNQLTFDYFASSPETDGNVSFYIDDDNEGYDGIQLESIANSDGNSQWTWDTSTLVGGTYWLYASLADGQTVPAMAYAEQSFSVGNSIQIHTGTYGNDIFIGGAGDDQVVFQGNFDDFLVLDDPQNSSYIVIDLNENDSDEGRDLLTDIEFLQFNDQNLVIGDAVSQLSLIDDDNNHWNAAIGLPNGEQITADNAQLYRLYSGAMGRTPDNGGYSWWLDEIRSGSGSFTDAAEGFMWSAEFTGYVNAQRGDSIANDVFLNHMYQGVFGREPDEGGFNWWMDKLENGYNGLDSGYQSQIQALVDMTQSNEFVELTKAGVVDYLVSNTDYFTNITTDNDQSGSIIPGDLSGEYTLINFELDGVNPAVVNYDFEGDLTINSDGSTSMYIDIAGDRGFLNNFTLSKFDENLLSINGDELINFFIEDDIMTWSEGSAFYDWQYIA